MYDKLAQQLDIIASDLESKGLLKEAEQLDVISNTMEKLALDLLKDNMYKKLWNDMRGDAQKKDFEGLDDTLGYLIDNRLIGYINNDKEIVKKNVIDKKVLETEELNKEGFEDIKAMLEAKKPELWRQILEGLRKYKINFENEVAVDLPDAKPAAPIR